VNGRLVAAGAALVAAVASTAAAAPLERVTIDARPTLLSARQGTTTLFGAVENRRAGEVVTIQVKDCGQRSFRGVASATTQAGGGWSTTYGPGINTTVRAMWNGAVSSQVTVRQRAAVVVDQLSARRFEVGVGARAQFWRKRLLFQRFDRRLGTWTILKTVVLTETVGSAGGIWSSAKVTASLPKGTLVRAVLPLSQARPCYLAGYSNMLRTT
jgi:hypothetical protein